MSNTYRYQMCYKGYPKKNITSRGRGDRWYFSFIASQTREKEKGTNNFNKMLISLFPLG